MLFSQTVRQGSSLAKLNDYMHFVQSCLAANGVSSFGVQECANE